jgi:hypothetical protein
VDVAWPAPEDWISLLEAVFAGPVTVIWMEDEGEDEGTETGMVLIPLDEDPLELGSTDGEATGLLDTPALALLDDPEPWELGDAEEDADGETGVETGTLEATGTEGVGAGVETATEEDEAEEQTPSRTILSTSTAVDEASALRHSIRIITSTFEPSAVHSFEMVTNSGLNEWVLSSTVAPLSIISTSQVDARPLGLAVWRYSIENL